MNENYSFSVRVKPELRDKIDLVADHLDRSRSWIVSKAIEEYVKSQLWQMREIEFAMKEADAGDFMSEKEMEEIFQKFKKNKKR